MASATRIWVWVGGATALMAVLGTVSALLGTRRGARAPEGGAWSQPRLQEWWLTTNPGTAELRWREEQAVLAAVRAHISPDDRVLELGCGSGWYTVPLARNCRRVVAIDRSPAMLRYLSTRLFREGLGGVEVRRGEFPGCLEREPAADGVAAVGLLDYMPDLEAALRGMSGALRPGGWLVATVPHATSSGRLSVAVGRLLGRRVRAVTEARMRDALRAAGLEVVSIRAAGLTRSGRTLVASARRPGPTVAVSFQV